MVMVAVDSQAEDLGKSPPGGLHVQEPVSSAEEYEESEIYNQVSDSKAGTPPTQYLDRSRVISDNLPISTLGRSQSRDGDFLHSQISSRPASRPSLSKGSKGETVPSQKPVKTQHLTQPVQQPVHQPVRLPQQPLPLTSFSSLEQSHSDTSYLNKKKKWKPDSDNSSNKPLELPKRFYLNTSRQEMKKQETSISRSPTHSISSLQYSQLSENENDLGKEKEIVQEKRKKKKKNKNEEIQGQTGEQTTN